MGWEQPLEGRVVRLNWCACELTHEANTPRGSWWRPTGGAARLGLWTRPPALYSPWRELGLAGLHWAFMTCRLDAPIAGGEITDGGLQAIDGLQHLTTLELHSARLVTDVGVRALASHTHLTTLIMSFCDSVTGEAFRHLGGLPALTTLRLTYCKRIMCDKGIKSLTRLQALTTLALTDKSDIDETVSGHRPPP